MRYSKEMHDFCFFWIDVKSAKIVQYFRPKKCNYVFSFLGVFLVVKFINHLEFFTDFISFNQAPCSRSKNQYKLGACQKMQNYIFFSNQNIYLYISITELSCIFFHVKKHLTSTKDACEKWWIVQFTISRVNNVPDIGGKPSK